MTLHHYGLATTDINASTDCYINLGFVKKSNIITDPIQNVRLQFLQRNDEPLVELVEPINEKSPISKILQKNGTTLYHSCYEVEDLLETISVLRKKEFITIVRPVPAVAFYNRLIAFLYHKQFGLIELLQGA